jgi:hypothetical protein
MNRRLRGCRRIASGQRLRSRVDLLRTVQSVDAR